MTCWPLIILALVFGSMIGALILGLMVKFLDWGNEAELRLAHHLNEIDDHATHWRSLGEKDENH